MPGSVSHPPLHTAIVCSTLLSSDEEEEDEVDDDTDEEAGIDTGGGGGDKSGLSDITNALSMSTPLSPSLSLVLL